MTFHLPCQRTHQSSSLYYCIIVAAEQQSQVLAADVTENWPGNAVCNALANEEELCAPNKNLQLRLSDDDA
jgi:hypothetical protein